jgi:hypothetical protein
MAEGGRGGQSVGVEDQARSRDRLREYRFAAVRRQVMTPRRCRDAGRWSRPRSKRMRSTHEHVAVGRWRTACGEQTERGYGGQNGHDCAGDEGVPEAVDRRRTACHAGSANVDIMATPNAAPSRQQVERHCFGRGDHPPEHVDREPERH